MGTAKKRRSNATSLLEDESPALNSRSYRFITCAFFSILDDAPLLKVRIDFAVKNRSSGVAK
jgi:hypothetical protein